MTFHPWRISAWYVKLSFIVVGLALSVGISQVVGLAHPPRLVVLCLSLVCDAAVFWTATRVFRGANENYLAPRAWWRMTSKPTLSRRLGFLWVVVGVGNLLNLGIQPFLSQAWSGMLPEMIIGAVEGGALAYLYSNSALRQEKALKLAVVDTALTKAPLG